MSTHKVQAILIIEMPKESSLLKWHRESGAEFAEEDGWIVPLRFGDPLEEYRAVRSGVGILDLGNRALLRFTGADRASYLQGMVSNDVKNLVEGTGIYAAILDVQGKILADVRVLCAGDSFLLDLSEPLKGKILDHLNRYLVADEVEIADLTQERAIISLQGPKARSLLGALSPEAGLPSRELDHRDFVIGGSAARVVRATHTGEEGFDLLIERENPAGVIPAILEAGKKFSLRWVGSQAREILRVEAGIPRYGIDMDESNLLLEAGLEKSVSFQKGCYLGQEVVERIRSRGHVNRRLAGMVLEGQVAADRGGAICDGEREIGRVTSSIESPLLRAPLALGYVHRDYLEPGTRVSIRKDAQMIPARLVSLPFYKAPAA